MFEMHIVSVLCVCPRLGPVRVNVRNAYRVGIMRGYAFGVCYKKCSKCRSCRYYAWVCAWPGAVLGPENAQVLCIPYKYQLVWGVSGAILDRLGTPVEPPWGYLGSLWGLWGSIWWSPLKRLF